MSVINPFEKNNKPIVTLPDGKTVIPLPVLKDRDKIRITNLIITLAQTTNHLSWFASRLTTSSSIMFERELHYFKVYGVDTMYDIHHTELRVGRPIELKSQLEVDASKLIGTCNLTRFQYQLKNKCIFYIRSDYKSTTCWIAPSISDETGVIDSAVWVLNRLGELKDLVEKLEQDMLRAI